MCLLSSPYACSSGLAASVRVLPSSVGCAPVAPSTPRATCSALRWLRDGEAQRETGPELDACHEEAAHRTNAATCGSSAHICQTDRINCDSPPPYTHLPLTVLGRLRGGTASVACNAISKARCDRTGLTRRLQLQLCARCPVNQCDWARSAWQTHLCLPLRCGSLLRDFVRPVLTQNSSPSPRDVDSVRRSARAVRFSECTQLILRLRSAATLRVRTYECQSTGAIRQHDAPNATDIIPAPNARCSSSRCRCDASSHSATLCTPGLCCLQSHTARPVWSCRRPSTAGRRRGARPLPASLALSSLHSSGAIDARPAPQLRARARRRHFPPHRE